jgi:hypothetical protein
MNSYLKLRQSFIDSFDWDMRDVSCAQIRLWLCGRKPPVSFRREFWKPMRDGRSVPAKFIEVFVEYLRTALHRTDIELSNVSECATPERRRNETFDPRCASWLEIMAFFGRRMQLSEIEYCENDDDIDAAARMVMVGIGRATDKSLSTDAAVASGEQIMKLSLKDYVKVLSVMRASSEYSIVFAVQREKGTPTRLGVSVAAAVSPEFYTRLRNGEAEVIDIGAADLRDRSEYIHLSALCENTENTTNTKLDRRVAPRRRGMLIASAVLSQFASLSVPRFDAGMNMIAFRGPRNAKTLESYNFVPVDKPCPRTHLNLLELTRPTRKAYGVMRFPMAAAQYMAMRGIVFMYQAANGDFVYPDET